MLQPIPDIMIRQGSIDDINAQQFLKISNYEDTVRQLDIYYAIGRYQKQVIKFFCLKSNPNDKWYRIGN